MNLSYFNSEKLYDAGRKFFLQELDIQLSQSAVTNLPSKSLLGDFLKGKDEYLINEIDESYLLGKVDDLSLERKKGQSIDLESESKKDSGTYKGILVFAIRTKSKSPTRAEIAKLTRALNRRAKDKPVILLTLSGELLTYSTAERNAYKQEWREGEKVGKITMLKDINLQKVHAGHERILWDMKINPLLIDSFDKLYEHWKNVFSVQLLNKNFYQELFHWYLWAKRLIKIPPIPRDEDQDEETLTSIFAIRLLTRLLFVWFVKEKRLIPASIFQRDYLQDLLTEFNPASTTKGNYYKAILQNLFFATLNTPMEKDAKSDEERRQFLIPEKRKTSRDYDDQYLDQTKYRYDNLLRNPKEAIKAFAEVPFLNGGLFECLDYREGQSEKRYDGFSSTEKKQALVPDILFFGKNDDFDLSKDFDDDRKMQHSKVRGIIDILNSYKFTITENTPLEEEIALDPELLGKVFENLLASYNPETKTTARKQTGSFYTPREIVSYMVDESLKAYLLQKLIEQPTGFIEVGKTQGDMFGNKVRKGQLKVEAEIKSQLTEAEIKSIEEGLNKLFEYGLDENPFSKTETQLLIESISKCKILDPACGSGAFPMGILHRMVHLLSKLDPNNNEWKKAQQKKAEQDLEIAKTMGDEEIRTKAIESANQRIKYIAESFNSPHHELDYTRKLFLIENCIYGVDIQQIAVQIAKLRFFISLMAEQKTDDSRSNRNILSMPNLETKFVAANTLIALEKPEQLTFMDMNPEIKKTEDELRNIRSKIFFTRKYSDKKKLHLQEKECRQQLLKVLTDANYKKSVATQMSTWNPFDQLHHSQFFDTETMFELKATKESEGVFNIVIGNPPYGILNKKQNKAESIIVSDEELNYFKNSDYYSPASGGMLNIFRLFILRSIRLLKKDGIFSEIFPLSFIGDLSIKKMRSYIFDNTQILSIEAFPERDNPNKRVFEAVKMSVCILNLKNSKQSSSFFIRKNDNRFVNYAAEKNFLNKEIIQTLDNEYLTLPLTSSNETTLLLKIFGGGKRFREIGTCNTGEIDMTFCKESFSENSKNAILLKGAIIDRYLLRKKMSQGEIVFIDEKKLSKIKNISREFKKQERIVLQGITGVNEKVRLKMMIVKDVYCANSLNYLNLKQNINKKYLLGLLNSKLLNFVFSKFSTNSNVNGYEVDNLPIYFPINNAPFIAKVDKILAAKKSGRETTTFEHELDVMVYKLYNLNFEEVKIIDTDFSYNKKEYDSIPSIEAEKVVPVTTVIKQKKKRSKDTSLINKIEF